MAAKKSYWLIKSEPDVYSIQDLRRDGTTTWEGVRNYQARNHLRSMKVGDLAIYYHSNAKPPAAAGVARVVREAYPDPTQFQTSSRYFDPKSPQQDPRWSLVDFGFVEELPEPVSLEVLKQDAALEGMLVRKRGMRLSVQPVERAHFQRVLRLGKSRS
jgi:predicted RNA-binding protein with PUA-like domain